jgi:hypothetical protein
MGICCASLNAAPSDIDLSDIDTCEIESQDKNSEETELQVKYSKDIKSSDIDPEDKQIYEGNFKNVSTITQSEIRIFLSSTFKGNIIY